eukprot:g2904.t1
MGEGDEKLSSKRRTQFVRDVQSGKMKRWCAPMVGASELAFRMFVRKYGADVCSTPMIYAEGFVRSESYRREFRFDPSKDRPLVVQICSKSPASAAKAAALVESLDVADAIELNVGCPQRCARKGGWGAFLMKKPDLLCEIVRAMKSETVSIPVFVKMRVYEDRDETIRLARRLEASGCDLLTVHGRTIEKKRKGSQLADWTIIRAVKEAVDVPVVSNGNIRDARDVAQCLRETRCDGVMSACGLLSNPALFIENESATKESCRSDGVVAPKSSVQLAVEYLDFAVRYTATAQQIRKHIEYILNPKRFEVHRVKSRLPKSRRVELMKRVQVALLEMEQRQRCLTKVAKNKKKKREEQDDESGHEKKLVPTSPAFTAAPVPDGDAMNTTSYLINHCKPNIRVILGDWEKEEQEGKEMGAHEAGAAA